MLIQELTGGTLQVLTCTQCEVMFIVDKKPIVTKNGYCPLCGSDYHVKVDKDVLEILKNNLVELKHFQTIFKEYKPISPEENN
jgi:NAD-dependent SIR2 family protein deacetylase